MVMPGERMGEVLVRTGLISEEDLALALVKQDMSGGRLGDVLVRSHLITEDQIAEALAEQKGLPHYHLSSVSVDPEAATLLPPKFLQRKSILPIGFDGDHLILAMSDPLDVEAIDDTELLTGMRVTPVVATASQIAVAIETFVIGAGVLQELEAGLSAVEVSAPEGTGAPRDEISVPIVRLINQTFRDAVREGASDVHFEPEESGLNIRYRVDGVLRHVASLPKASQAGLTSRIKIMAEMDIAERRRPQDGRIAFNTREGVVDLRVATIPTPFGEGVVVRILHSAVAIGSLDALHLSERDRAAVGRILAKPYGALLIAGPTGSGKTTTLYTALREFDCATKKIVTIEDPIEYRMAGVTQIAVSRRVGLTFATGLRSVLRFDPDVVMVGEVRDPETASIAVRAALTGHYVLSSIHTNDAPSALTRLSEMGVEPYVTSSAILGVVAQRLVRSLCPTCKRTASIPTARLVAAGFPPKFASKVVSYEAVGCDVCHQTGYIGRVGAFEVLEMDEEIAELAMDSACASDLRAIAMRKGMTTMRQDALARVAAGVTSLDEVDRVVV